MIKTEMWLKLKVDNIKTLYKIVKFVETLETDTVIVEEDKTSPVDNRQIEQPFQPSQPSTVQTEKLCQKCNKKMVIRTSARGEFWGCTGFKEGCRHTEAVVKEK